MSNCCSKVKYLVARLLFKKWALPKVQCGQISKAAFRRYVPRNAVILDCGAHVGGDSLELAKLFRDATIHSFEPVPEVFAQLKANTKRYPRIHCYPIALSNRNGTQHFYVSEGGSDGSSSLLEPKEHLTDHPDTFFRRTISVNTLTLDTWAEQQKVNRLDLLWLDMQGFELPMLQASQIILPTVRLIHTEVSTKETYKGVSLYPEYRHYLQSKGFRVLIEALLPRTDMGNVLFVRA